jgi:ABC-type transport system involved in cytochrome c biogenesis permease subunit
VATSGENYWPPTGRTSWPLTPEADVLDRLAYKTTIFAFPLFGAGVVLGGSGLG